MKRDDCKREKVVAVLLSCSVLAGCRATVLDGGDPGTAPSAPTDTDPTLFVPQQSGAIEVFVDDERLYWVTFAENQLAPPQSLRGCLKDQCASTEVTYYISSLEGPGLDVALDGVNVYWYRMGINSTPSAVLWCPRTGCGQGGPQIVIENIDETSIATDGTFLYWASQQETSVFRCALGNCAATETALAQTQASPRNLAMSGGYAYWIASDSLASSAVRRVATDGTSPAEDVATGQNATSSVTVHEPYVYFTDSIAVGTVLRCPVTGCPSGPTVVASGLPFPRGVVADDANAYWVNVGNDMTIAPDGSFAKCAVGGCGANATTVASSETFVNAGDHAVAIDGAYVYWVTEGPERDAVGRYGFPDAAIHRVAK
jgi:hypothetical protein